MYPLEAQELLDITFSVIVVIDREGVVLLINRKGCEVLECEKADVEGRNWFLNFLPEEQASCSYREFRHYMNTGEWLPGFRERIIKTKKGELKLIRWSHAYLRNQEGKIIAMLCAGEDVTEKKALHDMLVTHEKEKRKQMIAAVLDAQEKERLHIASELHDNVGQILTTCKLLLEGELQKENASPSLSHTYAYLQSAIDEIRTISHHLNPAQLDEIGLVAALEELVKKMRVAAKPVITLTAEKERPFRQLAPGISLSIFRIVQEQLNNIIKHADAGNVWITLTHSGNAVELEIHDDGRGFITSKVPKGLGLKNISNRVGLYNGKAVVNSAPGEGCVLSIYIPLGN